MKNYIRFRLGIIEGEATGTLGIIVLAILVLALVGMSVILGAF